MLVHVISVFNLDFKFEFTFILCDWILTYYAINIIPLEDLMLII